MTNKSGWRFSRADSRGQNAAVMLALRGDEGQPTDADLADWRERAMPFLFATRLELGATRSSQPSRTRCAGKIISPIEKRVGDATAGLHPRLFGSFGRDLLTGRAVRCWSSHGSFVALKSRVDIACCRYAASCSRLPLRIST